MLAPGRRPAGPPNRRAAGRWRSRPAGSASTGRGSAWRCCPFDCSLKLLAIVCDARHVLLPLLAERQHQEIAHERLVLPEGDRFPAAPARDVFEALLGLLVEVGQRRDGLQLVPVEPAMELALVLLVEPQTHVDGADDASLR